MGRKKKELSDEALVIAYRIKEARTQKYKTVREAAELFAVERTLWGHWEAARVRPQKSTLEKLAAFFGVSVEHFFAKPENWEQEKTLFLAKLTDRTKARKDYYNSFTESQAQKNPASREAEDPLAVFLQITRLISDAKSNVIDGKVSQETYDTHMRMIAEMAKVSLFGRK
ncbi:MAG: helix-turn-helix domain-containing protein [Planctomycetota bacterium]|jgi:transcriptional regulator with XRE-family HTH domain|nr:helix-turn-helix domain-containing protein [Planctomycetota bacterium]